MRSNSLFAVTRLDDNDEVGVLFRCDTRGEAEAFIAGMAAFQPERVSQGEYTIDGPECAPLDVPLVPEPGSHFGVDCYTVLAVFRRQLSEDLEIVDPKGKMSAARRGAALRKQLVKELQEACDNGMAGFFQLGDIYFGADFDWDALDKQGRKA